MDNKNISIAVSQTDIVNCIFWIVVWLVQAENFSNAD